jgi:hypothetical protein
LFKQEPGRVLIKLGNAKEAQVNDVLGAWNGSYCDVPA